MTIYTDIRGALQNRLKSVTGISSSEISRQGHPFVPTTGSRFFTCAVIPGSGRPATLGSAHLIWHIGTFEVNVVYPSGSGTGQAESVADTIKSYFTADTVLTQGTTKVRIRYSERRPVIEDSVWVRVPVRIGWYLYSQNY